MDAVAAIHRCLELAEKGRGRTGINPLVGAVLYREEIVIAEGWHQAFGKLHAEQHLLQKFEQKISSKDVLCINLEPCCHHGKTPPCTEAIICAGVQTVFLGMKDPDPRVAGKGIAALQKAGVRIIGPTVESLCRRRNKGFVSLHEAGRPFVTIKRAVCTDGSVPSEHVTTQDQDQWNHTRLRARHDAILVGVDTIIHDDPELTVRHTNLSVQPLRIVLDPQARIPLDARVVQDGAAPTLIVVAEDALEACVTALEEYGVEVLALPHNSKHGFDLSVLFTHLTTPRHEFIGITSILVEGGPKTWKRFNEAGVVDEEVILIPPSSIPSLPTS